MDTTNGGHCLTEATEGTVSDFRFVMLHNFPVSQTSSPLLRSVRSERTLYGNASVFVVLSDREGLKKTLQGSYDPGFFTFEKFKALALLLCLKGHLSEEAGKD